MTTSVKEIFPVDDLDGLWTNLDNECEELTTKPIGELKEPYPMYRDAERELFSEPGNTNATEGGNWRLKYGLRIPYGRYAAI